MQSGLYFGYLGLVDGILARIKQEVDGIKRVIATAGLRNCSSRIVSTSTRSSRS